MNSIKKILGGFSIILFSLFPGCKEDDLKNTISGFTIENYLVNEGNALTTLTLNVQVKGAVAVEVPIAYTLKEGTAKFNDDIKESSGELKFVPNQSTSELSFDIIGDQNLELTETFEVVFTYENKVYPIIIEINDDDSMEDILVADDGFYTADAYPSMQLAWSDEFNGTQLNTTHWTYELGNGCDVSICGWGNNELEKYTNTAANSRLEGGKLFITALETTGSYTSARIKTQEKVKVKYGRIDVRAKLPKGQGIWPAIWMLGDNITSLGWPACGEIDIMELVGHQPAQAYGTVHYNNGGYQYSSSSKSLTTGDFSDQFHVFSIVWDKNKITWYIDNEEFKIFTNAGIAGYPFNNSFFFIMNVAVGGNWPGPPNANTVFPQEMVVDYVRVFQ